MSCVVGISLYEGERAAGACWVSAAQTRLLMLLDLTASK